MASSSSSIASPKLYDAFISHRGPDVKETLAKKLYHLLQERGCRAFLDRPEIQGGDSIPFAIRNGICSSLVQIAIFSQGYATSSWCLDELVLMLEQQPNALFIPVFYDVQPWELRHIENEKSQYAAAFSDYVNKDRYLDKLDEWRKALKSAADISGYELSHLGHQDSLCENIVSRVVQAVQERNNRIPLDVAKYPIALAELVQDFESCCSETKRHKTPRTVDKVMIAGIYGLGGSGKTTLAKELFNRKRSGYHASSFLSDVRESHANRELQCLQSQLLKDLLKIEDLKISSVHHGIGELKDRLGRARHLHFLIVLDDIDHQDQLDALLPEGMLSSSSLVIITTRDQSMLMGADIRYKTKELNRDHAKELFCSHAFRREDPPIGYEKLIERFVEFCGGLPLSLKVLGAHLYSRDEYYWDLQLEKAKKIQHRDIMQSLKISFDGLNQEEKQIFIDIACLFNKKKISINNAILIWEASGWNAKLAVQTLQEKCLVQMHNDSFLNLQSLEMHDHLRDLGRQMADELGPPRLWKPDILRDMGRKGFKKILAETKARCFHSFLDQSLKWRWIVYFIGNSNDSARFDLLWLEIHKNVDKWKDIPSWIPLQKLQYLYDGEVKEIWSTFQRQLKTNAQASFELRKLKIFEYSSSLKLPDLRGMFSHLEELEIESCSRETDIASLLKSITKLSTLRSLKLSNAGNFLNRSNLNLSKCSLENSTSSHMTSLETIEFTLTNIRELLISGKVCPRLRSLTVNAMFKLNKMDLEQLERLNTIEVRYCDELETISGLSSLTGLQSLTVVGCDKLETITELSSVTGLQSLMVKHCSKLETISGLSFPTGLQSLTVDGCDKLETITELSSVTGLQSLMVKHCPKLETISGLCSLTGLQSLTVDGWDKLETITELSSVTGLQSLMVKHCPKFETISGLSSLTELSSVTGLQSLMVKHCPNLETISGLSSLTRLQSLTVDGCDKLETITGLSSVTGLQSLMVKDCPKLETISGLSSLTGLQSVEGLEEGQGLKSLIIEVPDNGYAWVRNCIYGLRRLPSEYIILIGNSVDKAASILDVNLFSEVIGVQGVTDMERRSYQLSSELDMRSSSSAITIYVLLVKFSFHGFITNSQLRFSYIDQMKMVTVLLPHHNSEGIQLGDMEIMKGFKVIVNEGEEGRALILMQRIFDRLYREGNWIKNVIINYF